jgi:hypothetical protein
MLLNYSRKYPIASAENTLVSHLNYMAVKNAL